jgi:hypothetical protein
MMNLCDHFSELTAVCRDFLWEVEVYSKFYSFCVNISGFQNGVRFCFENNPNRRPKCLSANKHFNKDVLKSLLNFELF